MTARTGLQMRSTVKPDGELEVTLIDQTFPEPGPDEVLVRVDATPINPSDLGIQFGAADLSTVKVGGTSDRPVVVARVPERAMGSQYRVMKADEVLVLPEGATAADGASCFVNPLTALGFIETLRRDGHPAIVHTAAASNLGQMLNRICIKDGIPLVNVVRRPEQVALLRAQGAKHVVDSSAPTFEADLTDAIAETGATLAFDATGGGRLGGRLLYCMEAALTRNSKEYLRYGSETHKQLYIYGSLDTTPTEFQRNFGFCWGISSWLMFPFLKKAGPEVVARMRKRVADELTTTFASHYTRRVSLAQALSADAIAAYGRRATGEKDLIEPNRGVWAPPGAGRPRGSAESSFWV
ncbi:MAG TPA: NADH oxidase [Burkholderiaceae bacterium]|nr:NADH oxidase [Burkholderiaceae bacterium]